MNLAQAQQAIENKKAEKRGLETRIEVLAREIAEDEAAFKRIASLLRNSEIAPIVPPSGGSKVSRAIEEAIPVIATNEPVFTSRSILAYLADVPKDRLGFDLEANRANVSTYLSDFAAQGLIQIVAKGSGRRGTTYQLPPKKQNNA